MTEIKFNINHSVRVKPNDKGWDILREDNARLKERHPTIDWQMPKADEDGYLCMQMWELMQRFGPHISLGFQPPFETTILLEVHGEPN